MPRSRKASAWLLAVLGASWLAAFAQTVSTGEKLYVRTRMIGEKLKCQCGCNYSVGSCNMLNCHFKGPVDEEIRKGLLAGDSEDTIIGRLKEKYGTVILGSPPAEGFNLLGWAMPFVALAIGLLVVRWVVIRWRQPRPAPAVPGGVVAKFQDQIEKELADLE
jgi:cytochrome c-type biogenesis protein CcmH/NrfF